MGQKMIISFSRKVPVLLSKARFVLTSLSSSPYFKEPPPELKANMEKLDETIGRLQKAHDESKYRDSQKIAFRKAVMIELIALLVRIAHQVDYAANGDINVMLSAGFDLTVDKSKYTKKPGRPPAPVVVLIHADTEDAMVAQAKPVPGAVSYEVHITDKDPTVAENWGLFGIFAHCTHILLANLVSGTKYSVRMRCVGVDGVGAWSVPVTLRCL